MTNATEKTIQIPDFRFAELEKKIAQLNRRAAKIGCPPVTIEVRSEEFVPSPIAIQSYLNTRGEMPSGETISTFPKSLVYNVEIVGEGPKIEGYKFIGTLDHYTIPGKVIVQSVPGEHVPPQFYESEAMCDHCNKVRNRVETFIVENENDGSYLQVGRNCLKDFFGHDPMAVARHLTRLIRFVEELGDEEEWGARSPRSGDFFYFDKKEVLKTTTAIIRTFGWVPRSAANEDMMKQATADIVLEVLLPAFDEGSKERRKELLRMIKFDKVKDNKEAEDALEWLSIQDDSITNSYMHNLHLINDIDTVPIKMIGYWCSLVSTYQRAMERLEYQKNERNVNQHFSEVGQTIEVRVKCKGVHYTEGAFGPVTIHRMRTEEGHTLIWFANTDRKMDTGCEYVIRARVKKHDEYKGWKQTNLTHVRVIETVEEEQAND